MVGKKIFIYILAINSVFAANRIILLAQDTVPHTIPDSLYQRILELEKTVHEMNNLLLEREQEGEMEKLMKEADRLSVQEEEQAFANQLLAQHGPEQMPLNVNYPYHSQ